MQKRVMPTHEPCNNGKNNCLKNVENPHGNVFSRIDLFACINFLITIRSADVYPKNEVSLG